MTGKRREPPTRKPPTTAKRNPPRCEICGRFLRFNGPLAWPKWQCPKAWPNGDGGWEHD